MKPQPKQKETTMSMTREQVLAEMEESFNTDLDEKTRTSVLFSDGGQEWTPALLLEAVRDNTEMGQRYVKQWEQNKIANAQVDELLAMLLGGGPQPGDMTCGQPDCPHCKGEVRPFDLDDTDPTIH
jgi:hypothetical protein